MSHLVLHHERGVGAGKAVKTSEDVARLARSRAKGVIRNVLTAVPLILLVVWTVTPFLVTLSVSLKNKVAVFSDPRLIPASLTLDAYPAVWASESFTSSLWNSVVVGVGTTVLTIVIAAPAAYAFARFRFRVGTFCSGSVK